MKKTGILLCILVASGVTSAQEVISTQGDTYTTGSAIVDFTIGEVVINTVTDGTNDITQGFHQTTWNFASIEDHNTAYEVIVFPNPTEDILNIEAPIFKDVSYILYDAQGRVVLNNTLIDKQTALDVRAFAPGNYSLVLLSKEQRPLKTFKLIKQQ
jgi:hypothetical protein